MSRRRASDYHRTSSGAHPIERWHHYERYHRHQVGDDDQSSVCSYDSTTDYQMPQIGVDPDDNEFSDTEANEDALQELRDMLAASGIGGGPNQAPMVSPRASLGMFGGADFGAQSPGGLSTPSGSEASLDGQNMDDLHAVLMMAGINVDGQEQAAPSPQSSASSSNASVVQNLHHILAEAGIGQLHGQGNVPSPPGDVGEPQEALAEGMPVINQVDDDIVPLEALQHLQEQENNPFQWLDDEALAEMNPEQVMELLNMTTDSGVFSDTGEQQGEAAAAQVGQEEGEDEAFD